MEKSLPINADLPMFNLGCKGFGVFLIACCFSSFTALSFAKDDILDQVLKEIRHFDFQHSESVIAKVNDESISYELNRYLNTYKNYGIDFNTIESKPNSSGPNPNSTIQNLNYGLQLLLNTYNNESQALSYLDRALNLSISQQNKVLTCEVIKAILIYNDRLLVLEDYPKHYLTTYKNNIYDEQEKYIFWVLEADMGFDGDKFIHGEEIIANIKRIIPLIKSKYYKSMAHKILGNYYDLVLEDYPRALSHHKKALDLIAGQSTGLYHTLRESIKINMAVIFFMQQKYDQVFPLLQINQNLRGKTIDYLNSYRYVWLKSTYEKLNQLDSAFYFSEKSRVIRNKFSQIDHASKVAKMRLDSEVNSINAKAEKLQSNLNTVLPILGILLLVLAILYYLFRNYKKQSGQLQEEKSETLQKLDELKQLVIKNHIVLKDKTKIYIADLMYIKAEDHYLKLFLSDGKNHLVRGKIKAIKEELPPNFLQCHRSYVVNSNFIKQVNAKSLIIYNNEILPISRSFKEGF
ncbi:LytR/AlgR family response regulator transcription factor [Flagellimonas myxillae]|uniref:LytR/AlgR family response regulator transcription factor n=1 Tax=Flagellimonas myxillae TaxID=2942214 RepID=UPI00201F579C|nr:LytTR family DNA-binding domain-containing protein [Muricauda myxillae]MCL6265081.1 LytTR family transcriptional regulator [Muricauda myxillae]